MYEKLFAESFFLRLSGQILRLTEKGSCDRELIEVGSGQSELLCTPVPFHTEEVQI